MYTLMESEWVTRLYNNCLYFVVCMYKYTVYKDQTKERCLLYLRCSHDSQ